ncbi:MAG: hypothetical protein E7566_06980 [Ruminococcaceae bacterium]|nr:hypothetical protein [Oscillospiraceae bacterium]
MKKAISLIFALVLMLCAVASVSAEVSPGPTNPEDHIIIDAIAVPGEAGSTTPDINNPGKVEVGSGEVITLTATPSKGYKFSHWEFSYGEFEWVEGDLTTPVIVIRPTGGTKLRAEAHFVKIEEPVTRPSSKPVHTLPPDHTSPITGTGNNTNVVTAAVIGTSVVLMAVGVAVVLKKKFNA